MPFWLTIILAALIAAALMFVWTLIARPFIKGFLEEMKNGL
jgi:hypothetical protein